MHPTAVSMHNLEFQYPGAMHLTLKIEELIVQQGELVFVSGPSGCGKTTLLGLLAGILPPSKGNLHILNNDMAILSARQRDALRAVHIGYIFQMLNLLPYLSVQENMELACRLNSKRAARVGDFTQRVGELAEALGVAHLLTEPVMRLSVGQQQRVAVVRALLGDPELVIADEPTSALDADNRKAFLQVLFEQCRRLNATLIFVSHDSQLGKAFPRNLSLTDLNLAHTRRGA